MKDDAKISITLSYKEWVQTVLAMCGYKVKGCAILDGYERSVGDYSKTIDALRQEISVTEHIISQVQDQLIQAMRKEA